jgi:selenocysteine-specific elongation factor
MQVIATAGHVDHGKSALVRALTGMDPDRWEAERRRGLTIDLGFAWLTLPSGERVAFVDVPGHERFVPNMLAGVGPVPAVMFVVAADEGWMPQSAEHLAVLSALGIRHGLLVVTRSDLADPGPALAAAAAELAASSLGEVESVAVSAVTRAGLDGLVDALVRLAGRLPAPDAGAPVRIWVDRAFSIAGSGTVVTGTLPAGTVRRGDELMVTPSLRPVRVRGIQSLGESADEVAGAARVALNLRGAVPAELARGMALVQRDRWTLTDTVDVRLSPVEAATAAQRGQETGSGADAAGPRASPGPPRALTVHVGAARTVARVRRLGGQVARLTLADRLALHVGDRLLLRDPGAARPPRHRTPGGPAAVMQDRRERPEWPPVLGAIVLDVAPPPLSRRGAAAAAAGQLASWPDLPKASHLLRRHPLLRAGTLRAMGVTRLPEPVGGDWLADPEHWAELADRLTEVVAAHAARQPLAEGMPLEAARAALGLPDRRLVAALARPPLRIRDGLVSRAGPSVPEPITRAVLALRADLAAAPFAAPEAGRLRELGLDGRAIAVAERAGLLLRISDQIVLAPGAAAAARLILARLPQPFSTAEARQALGTTRRVAIPLLEYLDRERITERLPDDRRRLRTDPSRRVAASR